MNRRYWVHCFLPMLVCCIFATAYGLELPLYEPDEPRPGDPDLSKISDLVLKELYLNTTVGLRELKKAAASWEEARQAQEALKAQPRDDADAEYILSRVLNRRLKATGRTGRVTARHFGPQRSAWPVN